MAIRLAITITAVPGKGAQLADGYKTRCAEVMKEPGCEQFEIFQSLVNPDRLLLLERWTDQAALDTHAKLNSTRPPAAAAATRRQRGARGLRVPQNALVSRRADSRAARTP